MFTCKGCESKIAAEVEDVWTAVFGRALWAGDHGEVGYYVPCPSCGHNNMLPSNKITDHVRKTAKNYGG